METQVLGVKPHNPFKNGFPKITRRRKQPPYYKDFNFPAAAIRSLQPPNLQDPTWRKLQLPSSPFLSLSCHPDKNIGTELLNHYCADPADLLINTCTTLHNLYHTTQPLPLITTSHHLITTRQLITFYCITLLIIWSLLINWSLSTVSHYLSTCTINLSNQAVTPRFWPHLH